MVFQSYALYPSMTVEKNLSFGLRMMNVNKAIIQEKIKKASELLQIGDLLHRKPSQLSGGQRQRVAIGRALVRDAKVFLFDEPLSNLDAKLRAELRYEIKKLHRDLGNTMTAGAGVLVYAFADNNNDGTDDLPVTLSVSGTESSGDVRYPASSGTIDDDRYGFAGNPYYSTIDWDDVAKTGFRSFCLKLQ